MTTLAAVKRAGAQPRYATQRTPSRPTLGPRVAEVSERLGKPFMPWQRQMMDVALEIDPSTGLLAYSEVDLVCMRQQGKSEALFPLMTHRCMGFTGELAAWIAREYGIRVPIPEPQRVLYLAQTADDARIKWRRVHVERLKASRLTRSQFVAVLTQNKEALLWHNGAIWSPGSATAKTGGTGDQVDLGMIDEAWSQNDNRTEVGLRPAMLTRPWRQLWVCSMVPGISRKLPGTWPYLEAKMKAGRARVDSDQRSGVAYFEFGAQPGLDPGDPATWWSCMPALGYILTEKVVKEDYDAWAEAGQLVDFEAEYLSWAPKTSTPRWLVIAERTWSDRYDANSRPSDPVAIGVASTTARSHTTIAIGALREDGDFHAEVVDRRPGVEWAAEAVMELLESWEVCAITINPAGPEVSIIDDLVARMERIGSMVPLFRPSLREVCAASARLLDATGQDQEEAIGLAGLGLDGDEEAPRRPIGVWHIGQPELSRSVAAATRRLVGQGLWEFDMTGLSDPIRAVCAALHGGVKVDWPGYGYDIRSSLG